MGYFSHSISNDTIRGFNNLYPNSKIAIFPQYTERVIKLYQTPDTIYRLPAQKIFAILASARTNVLTPPWITGFVLNTNSTTNTSDLLSAKILYSGFSPDFSVAVQQGGAYPNPSGIFEITTPSIYLYDGRVVYYWLAFDISGNASLGNIVDGSCTLIKFTGCCPSLSPDTSLASSYCIIDNPVPVELTTFTAKANGNNVLLEWSTATEMNNRGFEIQRAIRQLPGKNQNDQDFETIYFVEGKGTTTEKQNYFYEDKNLSSGNYKYRLKQIDFDGTFEYSDAVEVEITSPSVFVLYQNYPNPFNPTTNLKFRISNFEIVTLKIYDVLGNEIAALVNESKEPGEYEVDFDGSILSSGIYFCKLTAGSFNEVKKMVLMR